VKHGTVAPLISMKSSQPISAAAAEISDAIMFDLLILTWNHYCLCRSLAQPETASAAPDNPRQHEHSIACITAKKAAKKHEHLDMLRVFSTFFPHKARRLIKF
jgi:hypothetical protein